MHMLQLRVLRHLSNNIKYGKKLKEKRRVIIKYIELFSWIESN